MKTLRSYNKLFFGSNEELGYDKPSLSFGSPTKQFVFHPDIENIFTFPSYAEKILISDTFLIDNGAFGGISPETSDRIKYATDCMPIAEVTMKNNFGVYLCTWLYKPSLASNTNPIWIDRWYNPYRISEEKALKMSYSTSPNDMIKDSISIFCLEPNLQYSYFRFGNYSNHLKLNDINENKNLIYHLDDWNANNDIILQNTLRENDVKLIVNRDIPFIEQPQNSFVNANETKPRTDIKTQTDYILNTKNKSSYASIKYSPNLIKEDILSASLWVKTSDWANSNHRHIISNGFRSGWNLKINNGFYNPLFVFISTIDCRIFVYNVENKLLYKEMTDTQSNYSYNLNHTIKQVLSYVVDNDLFAHIIGRKDYNPSSQRYIFKVDLTTGLIIEEQSISGGGDFITFNYNLQLSRTNSTQLYNLDGNLISTTLNYSSDVDNYNNIWEGGVDGIFRREFISGTNYKPRQSLYNISNVLYLKCDHNDLLWVILKENNIYKLKIYDIKQLQFILDNEDVLSMRFNLTETYDLPLLNSNNFNFDLFYFDGQVLGYVADFDSNNTFIFNKNGVVLDEERFHNKDNYNILKYTFSSYTWKRKFEYIKNGKMPAIELTIVTKNPFTSELVNKTFSNPVQNFINDEWHHLAFTINKNNSEIKIYLDTILLNDTDTSYNGYDIFHIFETPLAIGTSTGRINLLTTEIKNNQYDFFKGYIDDFRYYHNTLTQNDIERIYTNKFRYKDLIFNIQTINPVYYVEEIERFFKFKLPGSKSQYYNIKISGFSQASNDVKQTIEDIIRNTIKYVAPAYSELYKITWI